jgi:hypothetical protein
MKHEIIYTDDHALIVSDEILKKGDFPNYSYQFIEPVGGLLLTHHEPIVEDGFNGKKVIAHRPLTDVPILKGVPLLPEFSKEEDDVEKVAKKEYPSTNTHLDRLDEADGNAYYRSIFKKGYNKAKETYKYTEEDILDAWELGASERLPLTREKKDKLIKSLQQPKRPKFFECEYKPITPHKYTVDDHLEVELKTITNSQGQIELVGEYTY